MPFQTTPLTPSTSPTYTIISTDPKLVDGNKQLQQLTILPPDIQVLTINQMKNNLSAINSSIAFQQARATTLQANINAAILQLNLKP